MYSSSGLSESGAETAWHNAINSMWTSSGMQALFPANMTWNSTSTSTMDASWKQTTKTTTSAAVSGTATQALPPHVALVMSLRTAQATKWGRGRVYLPAPGVPALATAGSVISAAAATTMQTAMNAFWTGLRGNVAVLILHRHGTKTGPGALSTTNVSGADFDTLLDTQRRRADKAVGTRTTLTV